MNTIPGCLKHLCAAALLVSAASGQAATSDADKQQLSVDEIAIELSNPVTALRSIGNEFEYRTFQGDLTGAGDQASPVYRFSPSFPFQLKNGKNILIRATIPMHLDEPEWRVDHDHPIWDPYRDYTEFLLRQSPQVTPDSGQFGKVHTHMTDVTWDLAYGGVSEGGFISMYGIAGSSPTNSNTMGARDQILFGPELAFGKRTGWGIIGAWAKHLVDVSGDKSFDTNETTIDVFFAHSLGNGWQIISNPTILYDWEADSGNKLLLPVGGGVSKTLMLGRMPLKMEAEVHYYIVSPDRFGPEWRLTFNVTPVISGLFGQ